MAFEAKIIADSICNGHRLTTIQLTHPRIVHAEFNTHCMFARNASSSRAIPFSKMVQKVMDDPFIPVRFGKNQKGMQAFEYLEGLDYDLAVKNWLRARDNAVDVTRFMAENLNVHKQIVNRLIEPWSWITVCVTGDWGAWSNYFALRCHKDAADDIQKQAYMAQKVYFESSPETKLVGEWHLPYVQKQEIFDNGNDDIKVSTGRCARTSYLTQEGVRSPSEDIILHNRLVDHAPLHASPMEHVCEAMGDGVRYAKYTGWRSYRHTLPKEYVIDFQPNYQEEGHL